MASLQLETVSPTLRLFKPEEVANLLGVGRTTVYTLMNEGRLRYIMVAGKRRIPHQEVESFIDSCDREVPASSEVVVAVPAEIVVAAPYELEVASQHGCAQKGRRVPEAPPSPAATLSEAGVMPSTRVAVAPFAEVVVNAPGEVTATPPSETHGVAQFLQSWLVWIEPRVAARTYESYTYIVEHYLIPAIGHYQLTQLTARIIDQLLSNLLTTRDDRPPLSPGYVKKIFAVLRSALNVAVRWEVLHRNVALQVKAPKVRRRHVEPPSDLEICRMIAVSAGDWYGPTVEFMVKTGTRRGEALATRWVDLDLDASLLYINGSLQRQRRQAAHLALCDQEGADIANSSQPRRRRKDSRGVAKSVLQRGTPKTECSQRVLVLPPSLIPMLRRLKERQQMLFANLRKSWSEQEYVFTTTEGTPVEPRNLNRYFDDLVVRAELPVGTTPHSLRHANITAMIAGQVDPRTAQVRAGHSDVRVTLDVYTHSNLDLQRVAAATIDARFTLPETTASDA